MTLKSGLEVTQCI